MTTDDKTAPVSRQPDQNAISLDLMNRMKMHGMAEAFRESLAGTTAQAMTPDSFLSMLLSREWDYRAQAAVTRLTKNASFRYKAYIEEIDYTVSRGLDRNQMERLATLDFIRNGQNLFITGSAGTGKASSPAPWDTRPAKEAYAHSTPTQPSFSGCSKWPRSRTVLRLNSRKSNDASF